MSENNDIEMQVKISKLESRLEHLETRFGSFMDELRVELKEIKSNTQIVNQVVNDQTYSHVYSCCECKNKISLAISFSWNSVSLNFPLSL